MDVTVSLFRNYIGQMEKNSCHLPTKDLSVDVWMSARVDRSRYVCMGQGITEDPREWSMEIKKKTKIPRVTDEGWNSQKQLSRPVE